MYNYSNEELRSIIKEIYKVLNVPNDTVENEDWSALPFRVKTLKDSVDINEKRDRQVTNLFSESNDHEKNCTWHKDWHTCSCGFYDWLNENYKLKI